MEENTFDWSKVHILALFRQYYGITFSMWQYEHMSSHGWGGTSVQGSSKVTEQFAEALKPVKLEILKRLGLTEQDGTCHEVFKTWYGANESFVSGLTDADYIKFEKVENAYGQSGFKDSTEYEKVLEELGYEKHLLANNVTV